MPAGRGGSQTLFVAELDADKLFGVGGSPYFYWLIGLNHHMIAEHARHSCRGPGAIRLQRHRRYNEKQAAQEACQIRRHPLHFTHRSLSAESKPIFVGKACLAMICL